MPLSKEDFFEARVLPFDKKELTLMVNAVNYKIHGTIPLKAVERDAYIELHCKLMYDFVAKGGSLKELE